jgi:hypothetical protein
MFIHEIKYQAWDDYYICYYCHDTISSEEQFKQDFSDSFNEYIEEILEKTDNPLFYEPMVLNKIEPLMLKKGYTYLKPATSIDLSEFIYTLQEYNNKFEENFENNL